MIVERRPITKVDDALSTTSENPVENKAVSTAIEEVNAGLDSKAESSHTHAAGDITSGTLSVARGGTGASTLTSGYALIGNGTSTVATRAITNNTSTSSSVTASTNLVTMNTLRYALNRTTSVAAADTNYTTYMARGMALVSSDTTPTVNGAICWTYG